jgi:F-type H+-transporting ATPase subunit b
MPEQIHIGALVIDLRLVLMNVVNFCIVAAVIYYFGIRRILATMDERRAAIEKGLADAAEVKRKLAEVEAKQEEIIKEARRQAQEIAAQARAAAKTYEEARSGEAAAKVEQMLKSGQESIEQERRKAFEQLRAEVARLVVATTTRVLARDLGEAEQARINKSAAEELAKN